MSGWAGDYESSQVWHTVKRKARKAHRCDACRQPIPTGARYEVTTSIYDGSVERLKRCLRCVAIWNHLCDRHRNQDEVDGWEHGDQPEFLLDCGHEYSRRWGEPPPDEIAELAFLLPGEEPGALTGEAAQ